jgi:hypothetical protein
MTNRLVCLAAWITILIIQQPAASGQDGNAPEPRYWKGNLHTHSLWSDGDQFPEMIADWYASRDYNFLALSDHNILSQGQRWMPYNAIVSRADTGILDRYIERFSTHWVETRGTRGKDDFAVRLKPLDEFRCLFEQPQKFIMIPGEEITDQAEGKPVHMNVTNVQELIQPVGGATVREAMQNNLRMVFEQQEKTGREMLLHLNHPNFGYGITAEEIASVVQERFFEVYNGHPSVNHLGDANHPSVEKIWDIANAIRLGQLNAEPLWGIATDDSHEYHGVPGSHPGRGWVMVRSRFLTPEHLILAMKRADFYASSGVTLRDITFDPSTRRLALDIAPADGAKYETQFVATLKTVGDEPEGDEPVALDPANIGRVVATVAGLNPSYQMRGNELYVRAVVTSSLAPEDPSFDGQRRQAWSQPVGWSVNRDR